MNVASFDNYIIVGDKRTNLCLYYYKEKSEGSDSIIATAEVDLRNETTFLLLIDFIITNEK